MKYPIATDKHEATFKLDGNQQPEYHNNSEVEKALAFVRFNQEMEGFEVTPELEDQGRKILAGELDLNAAIKDTIKKTMRG